MVTVILVYICNAAKHRCFLELGVGWWKGEGRWVDGRLRGEVKEENGRRLERVEYDDGDAEWHELSGVHWMPLSR